MKHPYADLLVAIAEGKEIQDKTETGYKTVNASHAVRVIGNDGGQYLRIKPATIIINGVVCEPPIKEGGGTSWIRFNTFNEQCLIHFDSQEARDVAYAALIKPFGEQT